MAGSTLATPSAETVAPRSTLGGEAWKRFRRHKLALAGAVILTLIVGAVLLGPLWWTVPINEIDFSAKLQGPSWAHPLGTDDLGQDLLARMLYGGRISIAVGVAAMLIAIVVGMVVVARPIGWPSRLTGTATREAAEGATGGSA
jgi:peptide/nickel transport system permease protein